MSSETGLRRISHEIERCPHCGGHHSFAVLVRPRPPGPTAVPLFGGGPARPALAFTCPVTHRIITAVVADPPDGEVIGPADPDQPSAEPAPVAAAAANPQELDYAEWIKASRTTALDFCKTMLTAATGAIPVYFAVLKYLGTEAASGSLFSAVGVLPPLLFLASAIVFALALRPRYALVTQADFAAFRAARLRQLNHAMLTGLVLFSTGVAIGIALGFHAFAPWIGKRGG